MSRSQLTLRARGKTHAGRRRNINDDHQLMAGDLGLFAVVDGMGGHAHAQVAARLAAVSIENYFRATRSRAGQAAALPVGGLSRAARRLVGAIRKANRDVCEAAAHAELHQGMGATIVAILSEPPHDLVQIAHVGDSRCYRARRGVLSQLTTDHTLLARARQMAPPLAPEHLSQIPKNVVTRALGMNPVVEVDLHEERPEAGDIYLLCSDGLTAMVPDTEISQAIRLSSDPAELVELLVDMANDAGGTDNVTAVALEFVRSAPSEHPVAVPFKEFASQRELPPALAVERCPKCNRSVAFGELYCIECGTEIPLFTDFSTKPLGTGGND